MSEDGLRTLGAVLIAGGGLLNTRGSVAGQPPAGSFLSANPPTVTTKPSTAVVNDRGTNIYPVLPAAESTTKSSDPTDATNPDASPRPLTISSMRSQPDAKAVTYSA